MSADLATPIRTAIVGAAPITAQLPAYLGSRPVFTRHPVPDDAPYPLVVVSADVLLTDQDGLTDDRPVHVRDVTVYGSNATAASYRQVEVIARAIRELFHRRRAAITVSDWAVVSITASGPTAAPTDDEQTVGRRVELTIMLARKG